MASIVASVSFVVGVWLYEFYFLPLGMALALLVAPMTKYLGRRSLRDDHEEEVDNDDVNATIHAKISL